MDDTETIEGYSPPSFSSEGFGEILPVMQAEQAEGETQPQVIEGEYTQAPGRRERKKRTPSNRRVEELIYERGTLEQQNMFLAQQAMERDAIIADQNTKLQAYQNALQQKEDQRSQAFDENLETREDTLLHDIKRAKEDGDINEEVRLINELADVKAKRNTHAYAQSQRMERQQQRAQQIQDEPYEPYETYIPTPPQSAPVNEDFQDWVENNPWYLNSPRLKDQADSIAQELADRLAFNNQNHLIGTAEFFESVGNLMHSQYGQSKGTGSYEPVDNYQDEAPVDNYSTYENRHQSEYPAQATNTYSSRSTVAPVTRRGVNMADQYIQNQRSSNGPLRALTKEEFAIARYLPVRQRGEGEADLVRRFSQAKNYPKSPLGGGSPHRLTII